MRPAGERVRSKRYRVEPTPGARTGPVGPVPVAPSADFLRSLAAQGGDEVVEFVRSQQDIAGLAALARPDDALRLEDVHQPARLREPDAQLALEHRRRPELRRDDQLSCLTHEVEVVTDVVV